MEYTYFTHTYTHTFPLYAECKVANDSCLSVPMQGHPIFNPRQVVSGSDRAPVANPKANEGGTNGYTGGQQDSAILGIRKGSSGDAASVIESREGPLPKH
jgi:hypothetical protein